MNKKILLGAAISFASFQVAAVPFAPTDARAMAMGGTGVASARTVHAIQFNPSLLANAHESDDFGLLLPQLGGYVADEDEFIDSADTFADADYVTGFDNAITTIETPINNIDSLILAVDNASAADDLTALNTATSQLATQTGILTTGTGQLDTATLDLTDGLRTLSQKALRGGFGFGSGLAFPSKKFSVAMSVSNSTTFSGLLDIKETDLATLEAYSDATDQYAQRTNTYALAADRVSDALQAIEDAGGIGSASGAQIQELDDSQTALGIASTNLDDFAYSFDKTLDDGSTQTVVIFQNGTVADGADQLTLDSEADIIAVAITEVNLSIAREFTFGQQAVAIGLTPKLQRIDAFNYTQNVEDEIDEDAISDSQVTETGFNLDLGASTSFGAEGQFKVGVVIKNLIGKEIVAENINNPTKDHTVKINPQVRAGAYYNLADWVHLAADLDVTENDPIAFEDPSQFAALGAELDVFGFAQLRVGYRTNLAASGQDVVSGGFGVSPFGLFHIDLGVYANTSDPEKEVGGVFEMGVDW